MIASKWRHGYNSKSCCVLAEHLGAIAASELHVHGRLEVLSRQDQSGSRREPEGMQEPCPTVWRLVRWSGGVYDEMVAGEMR